MNVMTVSDILMQCSMCCNSRYFTY